MEVISINLKQFPSVLYSEAAESFKNGYNPVSINDFDEQEQRKLEEILSVFCDDENELNLDDIATVKVEKGVIKELYAGSIWRNKDNQIVLTFGSLEFPLEIREIDKKKCFVFGNAVVNYDPKGTTRRIDDKDIKVPCLTIESDTWEDEENEIPEWEMEISFFFDSEKVKASQQLAAVNNLLKTGDMATFAELVKVKGSGKGFPVKLVDVGRIFHETKTEIPAGGLQFKVVGAEIGTPPEANPEYGYSLILEIAEPVPFPVMYKETEGKGKDRRETGRVLPYQSPVTRLTLSKASSPCKSLVNQTTGQFFETATTKKLFEWMTGEKGLYLMITDLDSKEPDRRIPSCQLMPGQPTNNNAKIFAEKFSNRSQNLLAAQASNGKVPFDYDAEAITVAGSDSDF